MFGLNLYKEQILEPIEANGLIYKQSPLEGVPFREKHVILTVAGTVVLLLKGDVKQPKHKDQCL